MAMKTGRHAIKLHNSGKHCRVKTFHIDDKDVDELSEAFQVCEEFDRNFNSLKQHDIVLQMKALDSDGDIRKIELDTEDINRILKNEE